MRAVQEMGGDEKGARVRGHASKTLCQPRNELIKGRGHRSGTGEVGDVELPDAA
jgi:hypothetical protein